MAKKYFHFIAENQPLYGLGDLHGDYASLLRNIKNNTISDCSFIILGDVGLGFYTRAIHLHELREVNNQLKERNIYLYLFRGNHDDPSYFNREITEDDEFMLSNIKVLPDYTVLTINGNNMLIVGGATSIDRVRRIQSDNQAIRNWLAYYPKKTEEDARKVIQPQYWRNEQPFLDTDALDEITADGLNISAVLTHSSPSFVYPLSKNGVKGWMEFDSKLELDLMYERSVMDNLYSYLLDLKHEIKLWVYGHYHAHNEEIHNDILFVTLFNTDMHFDTYEILRENTEQ